MLSLFEDMGTQLSPLGEISLRRLTIASLGYRHLYEVKLGNEYLMSSMFVDAEEAFSRLGLAAVKGDNLHVVVGGLDLVYTTVAAHSPSEFLNESNASFYGHENLTLMAKQLCPDGVFSMWSQN